MRPACLVGVIQDAGEAIPWGGAMRFELGDGVAAVTQLRVHKSDLKHVLGQLKRRPLNL